MKTTKKQKTYYKVVRPRARRGLISARATDTGLGITYIPNEWVTPVMPNSKIFVFSALVEARAFAWSEEQIWECEVQNPRKAKYYSGYGGLFTFWSYSPSKRVAIYKKTGSKVPTGTIFADAVKLIKQIT
jgi:hypothetical protein